MYRKLGVGLSLLWFVLTAVGIFAVYEGNRVVGVLCGLIGWIILFGYALFYVAQKKG